MKRKRYTSLKKQILYLILFSIAFFILLGSTYYSFVNNLIQQKERNYVDNILQQVAENIEDASGEMIRYANLVSNDATVQKYLHATAPLEKLAYSKTISNSILNLTLDSQRGTSISILDNEGYITGLPQRNYSVIDYLEEHYDIFLLKQKASGYTGKIYNTYDGMEYYAYFQTINDTRAGAKINSKIGVCIVMNTVTRLEKSIANTVSTPNAVVMVLDSGRDIIASSSREAALNSAVSQTAREMMKQDRENGSTQVISGKKYMVQYQEIAGNGFKIVSAVPLEEISSELEPLLWFGILLVVAAMAAFAWWGIHVFHSIASPILAISDFLNKDAYANLRTRLVIKEKNELGMLADQINEMLDRISEMTNVILTNQSNMYELDLAKKRAELSALQSQINPHFLYNTLDCIKGYGYLLDSTEIVEIINALSSMMRYCIKGADFVPLKSELEMVDCYLKIISIRFEGRFDLEIDVPEALGNTPLPRLTLQPIVENAVSHGLEPKPGRGALTIRGNACGNGDILIQVRDDGMGMSPETLSHLRECLANSDSAVSLQTAEGAGLALLNVHNRIRGSFGAGYGLRIESAPDRGTEISVRLPAAPEAPDASGAV